MSGLAPPNPLSYEGQVVVASINRPFPPVSTNYQFNVPTLWTDTSAGSAYLLVAKPQNVADWLQISGGSGTVITLTGNSGGAVMPTAGNINIVGDGTTGGSFAGDPSTSTLTLTLSSIPNSALAHSSVTLSSGTGISITGSPLSLGGTATISAGATVPLSIATQSGTVTPASNSFTVTGASGITTSGSGHTLTITGSGSGTISGSVQVFTTSGTYTPTSGLVFSVIEVIGGGGGGGGAASTNSTTQAAGGGGGGGGYARGLFTASTIGASQSVTIGAGGTAGSTSAGNGGTGGTTSVGSLISATGGGGGIGSPFEAGSIFLGGAGGSGTGGNFQTDGSPGGYGIAVLIQASFNFACSGTGGCTFFGGGGMGVGSGGSSGSAGTAGMSYGGGGSGAYNNYSQGSGQLGGVGFAGVVIITEYIQS